MWTTTGLNNESDVEQKFLFPFLVEPLPLGLGLPAAAIQTKVNIRRLKIGKGNEQKLYFPDYLVVISGFPLVVVEAKGPGETLEEAYREARLYAGELNALFDHGVAPARFVIACNGNELWFGHADHAIPVGKAECRSLGPYAASISQLQDLVSLPKLQPIITSLSAQIRPTDLYKPRRLLGGLALQSEEVGVNSFGATLTAAISPVFNPSSHEERANVARNAYISSRRRERYVDPIDRVIRAASPPSEIDSKQIENSGEPREVIEKLKAPKSLEHKVLLLIGSVGSGKSTFVDHLIEVALPKELLRTTVWCRINMNAAPVSAAEIYSWLRREIIKGCQESLPSIDFAELETLKKVFGDEISKFDRGVGKLYASQGSTYNVKLAEHLEELQRNEQIVANAHVRFACAQRGKLFIVVLDNCDKKTRDEQLLMFEAAQWLQKEFRCLVMLPLRDETYDNHRDQPPLDTALKDLVFRIEPPMFQQVLIRRVQYAFKQMEGSGAERLRFTLPNGFQVDYPKSDQAFYLTSIVRSLFEHDRFARRMIVGLSGRNMRRALEIFLEFCNSGHIGEDQIFKMRQSQGDYALPFYQVATVLLRMNRRFYDSDYSYVKNMFAAGKDDRLPSHFCRFMILQWLRLNFYAPGTAGLRGYYPKATVKSALMPYGLDVDVLDREFNYLLASHCVIAEHLRVDAVADEDLVRLGPAGFVHLELISNVTYLAAVAEDTWFSDRLQAERIASRIAKPESQLHVSTVIENAKEVVSYLETSRGRMAPPNGPFIEGDLIQKVTNVQEARDAITRIERSQSRDPWYGAESRIPRGSRHIATIANVAEVGCFVEFADGLIGLAHTSKMGGLIPEIGDAVEVEVLWVDSVRRRMGLRLLRVLQEEAGDLVNSHADVEQ